jgi:osmoprotectant transport system permease protein
MSAAELRTGDTSTGKRPERMRFVTPFFVTLVFGLSCTTAVAEELRIGSKRFTESYILGEILVQTARANGATTARHERGLGNTAILLGALQ